MTEKERIIELLKEEARELRRNADISERNNFKDYGLLRFEATAIEKMIEKIKKRI